MGRAPPESKGPWRYDQHGTALALRDLTLEGGATTVHFSGARTAAGAVDFAGGGTLDSICSGSSCRD